MKPYNCPQCGPVLTVRVHGDWVLPELKDTAFIVSRKDYEDFSAKITDETLVTIKNKLEIPRYLAMAEMWVEDNRKGICTKCGNMLQIPKPKPKDPDPNVNPGPTSQQPSVGSFFGPLGSPTGALAPGQQPPTQGASPNIIALIDSKFTEAELDSIITDTGENPLNYSNKTDKVQWLLDHLYP